MLSGKTVLVTGATGFIGGRLVEKLVLEHQARVRVLVRDLGRAARVARFPVEFVAGDMTDRETVAVSTTGVDTVFHCAYDISSHRDNIEAIRILLSACAENGVRRLVHLSTISVYEPLPDGLLTEESTSDLCGEPYADTKTLIEREVMTAVSQLGVDAVIVQPAIVYGPFCPTWIMGPITKMRNGTIVLPEGMTGLCNAVYVDDLVDACILASICLNVVGKKYLISGSSPTTWAEFYCRLNSALELDSIEFVPEIEISRRRRSVFENARDILREPNQLVHLIARQPAVNTALRFIYERLGGRIKKLVGNAYRYERRGGNRQYLPSPAQLESFGGNTTVVIEKARRELGYRPSFSFERGMDLTSQFIRWAYPSNRPR